MDQLLLENKVFTQKLVTYGHELGQTLGDSEGQGGLRAVVHGVTEETVRGREACVLQCMGSQSQTQQGN